MLGKSGESHEKRNEATQSLTYFSVCPYAQKVFQQECSQQSAFFRRKLLNLSANKLLLHELSFLLSRLDFFTQLKIQ